MESGEDRNRLEGLRSKYQSGRWQLLWFFVHLGAVYAIVKFVTAWLSGWVYGTLLPLLQLHSSSSTFQFLFSHLFAFSAIPAFFSGLANARFRHKAAQFIWIVPAAIL